MRSSAKQRGSSIDVLVAGASTGYGHMAAAAHIARAVSQIDDSVIVETADILEECGSEVRAGYETLWRRASTQFPLLYEKLYSRSLQSRRTGRIAEILMRCRLASYRGELHERGVAIYIATHPAAALFGAGLKQSAGTQLWVAATDYVLHEGHCLREADRIYAPSGSTLLGDDADHTLAQRVVKAGIPISADFTSKVAKDVARQRLRLNRDRFTVLVSFGGSALGGLQSLWVLRTLARLPIQTLVVTASDTAYHQAVWADPTLCWSTPPRIFRFVTNMRELLAACDIVVGKPGGLTATEAAVSGKPFGVVFNLPGQETFNCEAIVRQGRGVRLRSPLELEGWIWLLLRSRPRLECWSAQIRAMGSSSTIRIARDAVHVLRNTQAAGETSVPAA